MFYVGQLSPRLKEHPMVQRALCVRKALATGNYCAYFRLYREFSGDTLTRGSAIMDLSVSEQRLRAIVRIASS